MFLQISSVLSRSQVISRLAATTIFLLVGSASLILVAAAAGEDWPQWRGPRRDAVSREVGLRQEWTSSAPQLDWRAEGLGEGYSSVVVCDGRIYTIGRRDGQVICFCLDERTGALRWSRVIGETSRMPCSTPTVDQDRLYVLDPDGDLYCLAVENGDVVWQRSFIDDFGGVMMSGRGYGESPLVDGDRLVCTPGGPDVTVAALDKRTGELVWKSAVPELGQAGRPGAGFSSPVMTTAGGIRQYVQLIGRGLIGIRASDGKFLWGYNQLANQTANIPTPVVHDNFVFAANGYNAGSVLLKLSGNDGGVSAEPVYTLTGGRFQNHHGGVALIDGHIYGGHGSNNGLPTCLDLETGKIRWKRRGPGIGSASIVFADQRLYLRYQNGVIALLAATIEGYDLQGTFQLPGAGGDSWSHPVVANGRLLLREKQRLFAYDVRATSSGPRSNAPPPRDELATALHTDQPGRSLFRHARRGKRTVLLERISAAELTVGGMLKDDVAKRLAQPRGDIVIDLAGLPIRDAGLAQLAKTPGLCGLSLELCGLITDAGLDHLSEARALRVVRLTGTSITAVGLRHLAALPELTALDLEVCDQIGDDGCQALGMMSQLKALVLKKTAFEPLQITSVGLTHLSRLTALESLSLYGNRVNDDNVETLSKLTKLRELDLSLTGITDLGLKHVGRLKQLERLELLYSEGFAGPKITNAGLPQLVTLPRLTTLNLVGAKITDDGGRVLSSMPQLRSLQLANTKLSTEAVKQLRIQLPRCNVMR